MRHDYHKESAKYVLLIFLAYSFVVTPVVTNKLDILESIANYISVSSLSPIMRIFYLF